MAIVRRPRFQRSPTALPFQLTPRDVEIIRRVFEHRFLSSAQIGHLTPGSRQQTLRRLQALYHHGYLDRPRCQIDHFHQLGTRPIVYGLGKRGVSLVASDSQLQRSRWTSKNAAAKRLFLDHTLNVSEVVMAFELACRDRSDVVFIPGHSLSLPEGSRNHGALRWKVSFAGEEVTVIPDAVFALDFQSQNGRRERIHYFLEADRGTMPVIRRKLRQTSLLRKLLAYEATWVQGVHRTVFGFDRFRVLTVTTCNERVEHLRSACSRLQRGHGLFLFSATQALQNTSDLFSFNWNTAKESQPTTTIFA